MKKNLIPVIALGLLVTACGGGGGGTVSSVAPTYVPPADEIPSTTPVDAGTPLAVLSADHTASPIHGLSSDFFGHVQEAHNAGLTGEGTTIYGSDGTEAAEVIAPGANIRQTLPRSIDRSINSNDDFVGAVVIKNDTRNQDYIVFQDTPGVNESAEYEAGGAALIWDKFDNVPGIAISGQIDATRNADGSMNLRAALSPTELRKD